jgi:hypothetical protein
MAETFRKDGEHLYPKINLTEWETDDDHDAVVRLVLSLLQSYFKILKWNLRNYIWARTS